MAESFVRLGHEIHVITYSSRTNNNNTKIHIHEIKIPELAKIISRSHWSQWAGLIPVIRIIRKIKPDIVHGHYISNIGLNMALAVGYPKVLSVYGSDVYVAPRSRINKAVVKIALKTADLVHVGDQATGRLVTTFGCSNEKIVVLPWGVDTNLFSPNAKSKDVYKMCSGSPIIVNIRGCRDKYDVETYIKSVPKVLKAVPNAKFVLIGWGDKKKYIELAESLKICSSIQFIGSLQQTELAKFLASADIYVDTCPISGGFGLGAQEAMSCGLPLVVADIPGYDEAVKEGYTGYIFKKRDSDSLAEKIIMLASDGVMRKTFGERCRSFANDMADKKKNMAELERYFQMLVDGTLKIDEKHKLNLNRKIK
jgi:glycosyltransferase involved in cell wall biosynthesis